MCTTLRFKDKCRIIDKSDIDDFHFVKKFKNQGKQGIVGILKHKTHPELYCIYKTSQIINYLPMHEHKIMSGLNNIRTFCPHFCGTYKLIEHSVDKDYKKKNNIFEVEKDSKIKIDTMLTEYIPYKNLELCIKNKNISDNMIHSVIKQILIAIDIGQRYERLTHYDLHSGNILMAPCNKHDVFLYKIGEHHIAIPTYGCYPKIIDFGFSYSKQLDNDGIYSSLAHTEVGFLTNQFDAISDPKLFLVTVSDELRNERRDPSYNTLRKVVRNIFNPLDINWENGWDLYSQDGASSFITEELIDTKCESKLFTTYNEYCIDLIQSVIILPLQKKSKKNLQTSYKTFTKEFSKLEAQFEHTLTKLYVLKKVLDISRGIRPFYEDSAQRHNAVLLFKRRMHEYLTDSFKYCLPKSFHYEKFLCSLFVLANACEGMLYDIIKSKEKINQKTYDELRLKTPIQIYSALETNIPNDYVYNQKTRIHIFDCDNKKKYSLTNIDPDVIHIINKTKFNLMKGYILYDYFKNIHIFNKKPEKSRDSTFSRHARFNYTSSEPCTESDSETDFSQ